ncbi:hypothetical protein [Actinoplanes sp. NPDC049118]|uniref:hypothetical protein n=1 Tax=Actinoplanes sp. NPDC049118 TaxID=3155769 RepID=UPI0034118939
MSNAEPSASAGENPSVSAEDIQNYVTAVDNFLLDVPWRHRRELIADLQEHLREHPDQITVEQPQDYAAELRAAAGAVPGGLLSGFRSASWPTPLEWWESVVRGGAIVLVALVVWELPKGWSWWSVDSALQSVYPVPRLLGSHRAGLVFFPLLSVLIGQLTTGAYLGRSPHGRPTLRRLSYVSLGIVLVLLGYGAVRSVL